MNRAATPTPGPPSPDLPSRELLCQREALRRGLRRTNVAWGMILIVITALTFGVMWKAGQSAREADRANREAAEALTQAARAESELWNARLANARTARISAGPGDRTQAQELIRLCSESTSLTITQRQSLRAEAIRLSGLVDILPPETWVTRRGIFPQTWDHPMRRYIQSFNTNLVEIKSYPSGQALTTLVGPPGSSRQEGRFSPDGRFLVCVFQKPSVAICWRLEDQSIVFSNRTTSVDFIDAPFFSPDNRTLAVTTTNGLELHPLHPLPLLPIDTPGRTLGIPRRARVEFSPDSRWIASVRSTNVEIHSASDHRLILRRGLKFVAHCLAWHPDGTRLALAGQAGKIILWSLPQGWSQESESPVSPLPEEFLDDSIADAPTESAEDQTLPAAGSGSGLEPAVGGGFRGHVGTVVGVWFSPDGTMLLSHSWDSFSIFWNVATGRKLLAESRVTLAGFSADGRQIMASQEMGTRQGPARLLNRNGFRALLQAGLSQATPQGVSVSGDGKRVATDEREHSILWDHATGLEIARVRGRSPVFSSNSQALYTVVSNAVLQFDLTGVSIHRRPSNDLSGQEVFHRERGKGDVLNTVSLAPDGRTLVVSASEGGVILVDLRKETKARRIKTPAHYASLSADGQWLVAQMHNRQTWLVHLTNTSHPRVIGYHLNAGFSPDGAHLALSTEKILILLQRDAKRTNGWSRRWEVPLEIGAGAPAPIAFTPDGTSIVTPYNRYDLRLIDLRHGQELATFSPPDPAPIGGRDTVAFSADGQQLLALRTDGQVVEWNLPTLRSELAGLGLDWRNEGGAPPTKPDRGTGDRSQGTPPRDPSVVLPPRSQGSVASVTAAAAGLFALVAGAVLFLHQRRTVAAYARAEELAEVQQRQLALAQDALFQSQKMEALGTLAAGVAHDFNNLLSIIRMSNQLVARATQPEGNTRENIDAIERAVKQGKAIVDSMLGYSRRPIDSVGEFSVAKAVGDTVALLSRQFLSGLRLNLEVSPECPPLHGSPARLEQALLNLILNSSEAMHGTGTLSISACPAAPAAAPTPGVLTPKSAPAHVIIEVSDTGPGIPTDVLPRIFEPFFTTKTAAGHRGAGLGLSLVYAIARQDGWGLDVTSLPGRGATFHLILPAASAAGGPRLPTASGTPIHARVRPPKPT